MKLKELKKRKVMKSLCKEASDITSTSNRYDANSKDVKFKRLREKIEFAVNQLRLASSLTYIWKACDIIIENSIQQQINLLQSQTNNKLDVILRIVQQNGQNIEKGINKFEANDGKFAKLANVANVT